jgi:signal transduction histidine kinase
VQVVWDGRTPDPINPDKLRADLGVTTPAEWPASVQNAIAYGTCADVSLTVAAGNAEIVIADRGPGIPPGERQAVFEPFYRLETSRSRSHGGTGLGLAVVQQIVDRHGGSVSIGDRAGGGAEFTVRLPVAP